ncbi:MAG: HAD superfamily hydrolase (TIGR01509 family) [Gammaproteobacteria bacterium]|jgi:HAD superfamily hydrolase (TIGR01509 family)
MNKPDSKFSAVIFDLDGTLIDSEPVFKLVAKKAASEFDQCFTDELYLNLIGLPNVEVARGIVAAFGEDFPLDDFRVSFEQHWRSHVDCHGIPVKSGVLDLIGLLNQKGVPYAIATSTPHERARHSLKLAEINHHFDYLIGGDEVENGKPAPDIYVKAAQAIATSAEHCIALEDSKVGVSSAAAANMYTIMIPDLKPPDEQTTARANGIFASIDDATGHILELLQC